MRSTNILRNSNFVFIILLCGLSLNGIAATYEKTDRDYGHKTIFFVKYEVVSKVGIDYKSDKPIQYQEGYVVYSEIPSGTERRAACLADICEKWTKNPSLFEKYVDTRANVKTDERFVKVKDSEESEECIIGIKLIKD